MGRYHPRGPSHAAWIELMVDEILEELPRALSWIPLARDLVFGTVLFHEIGHHLHVTHRSLGRSPESSAEVWRVRLSLLHLRRRHAYVRPFAWLFAAAARMVAMQRRAAAR
jgi:hypothetical protein